MYRLGNKVYSGWRHKKALVLSVFVSAAVIVLVVWYFHQQNKTVIVNPSTPITATVKATKPSTKIFNEGVFSITLPSTWKKTYHQSAPYNIYVFKDTAKGEGGRYMDVYVDTIPLNMAINKLLPVTVTGNSIVLGSISDNCSNFTGPTNAGRPESTADKPSKWQGVGFICDLENYGRDVVGTGSLAGVNKFTLSGKSGLHSFFFVYTDNTAQPEYQTLSDVLYSLKVN